MINPPTRESEARLDVFDHEIRQLLEDLSAAQPRRQEVEHVRDTDAHPAHARTSSALGGVRGDTAHEVGHRYDSTSGVNATQSHGDAASVVGVATLAAKMVAQVGFRRLQSSRARAVANRSSSTRRARSYQAAASSSSSAASGS